MEALPLRQRKADRVRAIVLPRMLVTELQSHEQHTHQNTMRKKSSKSSCTARCGTSVLDMMDVQQVLSTSTNLMLFASKLLSLISDVQNKNKNFKRLM